jgi:hypothetical protein
VNIIIERKMKITKKGIGVLSDSEDDERISYCPNCQENMGRLSKKKGYTSKMNLKRVTIRLLLLRDSNVYNL